MPTPRSPRAQFPPAERLPALTARPVLMSRQTEHKFSSTQVNLRGDLAHDVLAWAAKIPNKDLADDGRETEPHVTVKYGLHCDHAEPVRKALAGEKPVTIKLGEVSVFPANEKRASDVVIIDVESEDLHRLHGKLCGALPNTNTYPHYHPHLTLAYVKPGLGKQFAGRCSLTGKTATIDRLRFSDKAGVVTDIPLNPPNITMSRAAFPPSARALGGHQYAGAPRVRAINPDAAAVTAALAGRSLPALPGGVEPRPFTDLTPVTPRIYSPPDTSPVALGARPRAVRVISANSGELLGGNAGPLPVAASGGTRAFPVRAASAQRPGTDYVGMYGSPPAPPPRPDGPVNHPGPQGRPLPEGARRDFAAEANPRDPEFRRSAAYGVAPAARTTEKLMRPPPTERVPSNVPSYRHAVQDAEQAYARGKRRKIDTPGVSDDGAQVLDHLSSELAAARHSPDAMEAAHAKLRDFLGGAATAYGGVFSGAAQDLARRLKWQHGQPANLAAEDWAAVRATVRQLRGQYGESMGQPVAARTATPRPADLFDGAPGAAPAPVPSRMRRAWELMRPAGRSFMEGMASLGAGANTFMSREPGAPGAGRRYLPDPAGALDAHAGESVGNPAALIRAAKAAVASALGKAPTHAPDATDAPESQPEQPAGDGADAFEDVQADPEADALLEYLHDHDADPWATAVLFAAVEQTGDVGHAVEIARKAVDATAGIDVCGKCGGRVEHGGEPAEPEYEHAEA